MKFKYSPRPNTSWRLSNSKYPLILFLSLFLQDCARIRRNIAAYDAEAKARQPQQKYFAKTKALEKSRLVTVKMPIAELKIAYMTRVELAGILESKARYKRMEDSETPVNALGYLRVMFTVEDIDDTFARLGKHGAKLVGRVVQYEIAYRLCYIRGPE